VLPAPVAGTSAPPFELPRADGSRTSLADHAGRAVLLHFWATWCPPCRRELPALEALRAALEPEGLSVLAVSVDAGSGEAVARFTAERAPGLDVLLDPREHVARRYAVGAYPTSVVIDRGGRVVHRAAGAFAWDAPESLAWFRALLAQ
jgi:peroxiredoxin